MFISVCGTHSDYSTTSTQNTGTQITEVEVYYIHSKEDFDCVDGIKNDEKEWMMTGWNNPRKVNLPKFNIILPKRKLIRNALPRKVRECHY